MINRILQDDSMTLIGQWPYDRHFPIKAGAADGSSRPFVTKATNMVELCKAMHLAAIECHISYLFKVCEHGGHELFDLSPKTYRLYYHHPSSERVLDALDVIDMEHQSDTGKLFSKPERISSWLIPNHMVLYERIDVKPHIDVDAAWHRPDSSGHVGAAWRLSTGISTAALVNVLGSDEMLDSIFEME